MKTRATLWSVSDQGRRAERPRMATTSVAIAENRTSQRFQECTIKITAYIAASGSAVQTRKVTRFAPPKCKPSSVQRGRSASLGRIAHELLAGNECHVSRGFSG